MQVVESGSKNIEVAVMRRDTGLTILPDEQVEKLVKELLEEKEKKAESAAAAAASGAAAPASASASASAAAPAPSSSS